MSFNKLLLIGRGISGAVLSLRLMEQGLAHDIIDEPSLSSSSKIAAGLMNPLVLKRLKLVQGAGDFLNHAPSFYQVWEEKLQKKFYYPTPLHHVFASQGEVNEWMEKSTLPIFENLLGPVQDDSNPLLPAPFGVGILDGCGWLDTQAFLDAHRYYFSKYGNLTEERVTSSHLAALQSNYDKLIICNGHLMRELFPEFDFFRPTRGEVMTIRTVQIPEDVIRHGRVFLMPLGDNLFKVGATYHWDSLRDIGTEEGLNDLKDGLKKLFKGDYEVIEHKGGVRPNVKDRKPLLGKIPVSEMYSFNGMGSRAVLMTPYLSKVLIDYMISGSEIPDQYHINRF